MTRCESASAYRYKTHKTLHIHTLNALAKNFTWNSQSEGADEMATERSCSVRPRRQRRCNDDESVSKRLPASCRRPRDCENCFRQMGQLEAAPPPPAAPTPHLFTLSPHRMGQPDFHTYFMGEIRHLAKVRGRLTNEGKPHLAARMLLCKIPKNIIQYP